MTDYSLREPALLGIPEERHIAATRPMPPQFYREWQLAADGGVSTKLNRLKLLSSEVFYVRNYPDCVVIGDRGLAFAHGTDLVRESRYLCQVREPPTGDEIRPLEIAAADVLIATNRPWRNYYHWLLQCMFAIWVAERFDRVDDRVFMLPAKAQNRLDMLATLGVPEQRLAFFPDRGAWRLPAASFTNAARAFVNPLLADYRDFLVARNPLPPIARKTVYISRRDTPKRKLAIEAEIERELAARGVEIVVASELSLPEQIATFAGCERVIAAHGAGLTNILFCRPGTEVVEIRPSYLMNQAFTGLARVCGLTYALVRVDAADSETRAWGADLRGLLQILDDPRLFATT